MDQLVYQAKDVTGKTVKGYVKAESMAQAIDTLSQQGLTEIVFHSDVSVPAPSRDHLNGLDKESLETMAQFEIEIRRDPSVRTFVKQLVSTNKFILILDIALLVWGVIQGSAAFFITGCVLLTVFFGYPIIHYCRHGQRYLNLLKAYALGQWPDALALINKLQSLKIDQQLACDLDMRKAYILSKQGHLKEGLQVAEKWRESNDQQSPGFFEGRLAVIYAAAGENEKFVHHMRLSAELLPGDASRLTDWALAEARLGDVNQARILLEQINENQLPVFGKPFLDWAAGIIALREASNNQEALKKLTLAVQGMMQFSTNPAVWSALGLCSAAYAVALANQQQKLEGERILKTILPILKAHGDRILLEKVKTTLGEI